MLAITPGREELLARAERLVPVLRERSAQAESLRQAPEETIADFQAAGLFRMCQPARYGGYELGWDTLCEVGQTLARGCGAQAWVQNILNDHTQLVGTFPLEAQDEVWANDPDARISASFDPVGRAQRVSGGVRYSGKHGFSSGIDWAQWVLCGGKIISPEGADERCFFLIPKSQVRVIDDWDVVGLAGSGSKSFVVDDVFVPEYRILRYRDAEAASGPGLAVNAAPIFRLPRGGITSTGFAAIGVGIAEGFLGEFLSYTRPRRSRGELVAAQVGTQMSVGVASAHIGAAARGYIEPAREAMRLLQNGASIGKELKLRAKRDSAFACQSVVGVCTQLFIAAGGRAYQRSGAMQRQLRDLIAVTGHHSLAWDSVSAEYGAYLLSHDRESEQEQASKGVAES
jgi:3-hydroxy-9,10-secoandrosta-1,3,5(10)-triene-9,17-dione monooxygenase